MYTIREHRRDVAMTGVVALGMVALFLACLFVPWWVMHAVSPWLAIPLAVAASLVWARWGLWATGGPAAVLSRVVIFGMNGLLVLVALLRAFGR